MSDDHVYIRISSDSDLRAGLRFEEFPNQLAEALRDEISAITREAFIRYRSSVPVRTGKLLGQVREAVHYDAADRHRGPAQIRGVVYIDGKGSGSKSDYAKAGALEYGSTGKKFKVAAHDMSLRHVFEEALAAPTTVLVKAFERHSTIKPHRFARGTINAMAPEVNRRLEAIVTRTVGAAND